jgi:ATP-dependent Clp protease protease subunit
MKLKQIVLPGRPRARALAKSGKPFKLDAKALADAHEIAIYGEISADDGSALAFRQELGRAAGKPVTVYINSDGGDVFEGLAIYNEMLAYPGEITVRVMSMAGSAASVIAMGGDRIEIAPNAQMMVHQAWVGICGNADDFEAMVPTLRQIDNALIDTYVARTGRPRDEIEPLVKAETYMSAAQCVEMGFADAIMGVGKVFAKGGQKARSAPDRREKVLARLAVLARSASASL